MLKRTLFLALLIGLFCLPSELGAIPTFKPIQSSPPSFEVATIKPVPRDERRGMYATIQSAHEFMGVNYSLKHMISFAYALPLRAISGGPAWTASDFYDIKALTQGTRGLRRINRN